MEKNILFPKLNGFVHGGDYNPELWLDRLDILASEIIMGCVTITACPHRNIAKKQHL